MHSKQKDKKESIINKSAKILRKKIIFAKCYRQYCESRTSQWNTFIVTVQSGSSGHPWAGQKSRLAKFYGLSRYYAALSILDRVMRQQEKCTMNSVARDEIQFDYD